MTKLNHLLLGSSTIVSSEAIGDVNWDDVIKTACQIVVAIGTLVAMFYKKKPKI